MIRLQHLATAIVFSLSASAAMASPILLITHNTTDLESNAYVAGTIQSHYPSKPHNDNKVSWVSVKMACFGHTVDSKCPALIKMATNTPNPIEIGTVTMDLNTGDITPKQIIANGFTLMVNGPGETTLIKN